MTIKITPEHEAWRKKKAEEFSKITDGSFAFANSWDEVKEIFLAGMATEHEVAQLMGRIQTLQEVQHALYPGFLVRIDELKAQLKALLAGKENHDHTEA